MHDWTNLLQQINKVLKVEVVAVVPDEFFWQSSLEKVSHFVGKDEAWNSVLIFSY